MNAPIRIALADDHKLVRSGMASILNSEQEFVVVQQSSNGRELLDGLQQSKPDVILLDLEMPVLSGKETLEAIRNNNSEVRILILTMHQNNAFIIQMMELGANGYLIKDTEPEEVVEAIRRVHSNGFYFSERVSLAMLNGISHPAMKSAENIPSHGLSERELDVLRLICKEHTTTEIGEALFLSAKTIEGYRKVLMEKIGARNMAGMVLFAVRHRLIED
jgi:DNA-binding NarL/FixJ family response regulator